MHQTAILKSLSRTTWRSCSGSPRIRKRNPVLPGRGEPLSPPRTSFTTLARQQAGIPFVRCWLERNEDPDAAWSNGHIFQRLLVTSAREEGPRATRPNADVAPPVKEAGAYRAVAVSLLVLRRGRRKCACEIYKTCEVCTCDCNRVNHNKIKTKTAHSPRDPGNAILACPLILPKRGQAGCPWRGERGTKQKHRQRNPFFVQCRR